MKLRLLLLSLLLSITLFGQSSQTDSLQAVLKKATADTSRVQLMLAIGKIQMLDFNLSEAMKNASEALALATSIDYQKGMAKGYRLQGSVMDSKSNFDSAIVLYNKALDIAAPQNDQYLISALYQDIANAYYSKGSYDKALNFYMQSLHIREQKGDSSGIANSYMGLSNVYNEMHRSDLTLVYAKKALAIKERLHEEKMVSWLLNNLGAFYLEAKDTNTALHYYFRSIELKKKLGDKYGLATTYKNVGSIFYRHKQFGEALKYYQWAYDLRFRLNPEDYFELSNCFDDIGAAYDDMGRYDSALFYIEKAVAYSERTRSFESVKQPYYNMSRVLYHLGRYREGYDFLEKHITARDSTLNSQTNQLMTEMAAKYDNEKKEQQLELQGSEIKRQNLFKNYLLIFIFLIVLFALVVYRGYRNKKKANNLLAEKNELIEQQKQLVETKNKDITDSIHYAQRIQKAILPPTELQHKLLPESFVLFKPKDIVSGDFYWIEQWGKKVIVAAIDCTGHGVPGAFMTFVAYSLLNEAVLEHGIDQPAVILNEMRRNLNKMLRQKNDAMALKDGMDISLCAFDLENNSLEFAGAFNPLWMIRNGKLTEIKGDKQPIGVFGEGEQQSFTNHKIEMQKGDQFYLFTDGFADQFGGEKGKKFKQKTMQQLLLSASERSLSEQRVILEKTIEDWRGSLEQVDDMCVIGVRV